MITPLPFSNRTKKVLGEAAAEARRNGFREIEPEHLLLGILTEGHSLACEVLVSSDLSPLSFRTATTQLRISHSYRHHYSSD